MKTLTNTLIVMSGLLTIVSPALSDVWRTYANSSVEIECFSSDGNSGENDHEVGLLDSMGDLEVSATNGQAEGTAWSNFNQTWINSFQLSQGLQYDQHYSNPFDMHNSANFEATMFTGIEMWLEEKMELNYSFDWDTSNVALIEGEFQISSILGTELDRTYDSEHPIPGGSIMLDAGYHHFTFSLSAFNETPFMYTSDGYGSFTVDFEFTPVPAPGALALLGLAGCAARRRRR